MLIEFVISTVWEISRYGFARSIDNACFSHPTRCKRRLHNAWLIATSIVELVSLRIGMTYPLKMPFADISSFYIKHIHSGRMVLVYTIPALSKCSGSTSFWLSTVNSATLKRLTLLRNLYMRWDSPLVCNVIHPIRSPGKKLLKSRCFTSADDKSLAIHEYSTL